VSTTYLDVVHQPHPRQAPTTALPGPEVPRQPGASEPEGELDSARAPLGSPIETLHPRRCESASQY
jgi:hypothetical protein